MSNNIDQSFVQHFQADVHLQYQQIGSKLRNTVRVKNNIIGASSTFQKVGKGTASTKARHGKVPVMSIDHTPVTCTLSDYYAGDWVDSLDELKLNINERMVVAKAGAYALGRKTDELIINQLDASTNYAGDGSDGLTKAKVLEAFELLGEADVPDDGQRFAIVGWKQWSDLLGIEEFANADYIGDDQLPWKGTQAKRWLGSLWIPHSNLTKDGGNVRFCYWYHKTAIGHAVGKDVKTDITWHGDRASNFVNKTVEKFTALQGRVDAHAGLPAHPRAQDRITRLQSAVENLAKATNRNAETLGDIRNDLRTLVFKLLDRERKAVR